jgi:hypothetical protein
MPLAALMRFGLGAGNVNLTIIDHLSARIKYKNPLGKETTLPFKPTNCRIEVNPV